MSGTDPRADTPPLNWSDLGVSELPTGTVTLLLADIEGSTRLWQTEPDVMSAAIARLDATLADLIAAHDGVRPVEQGEGDSFVLAFARASDAVACALELQRAQLAPIRLRIGVHTGEVQLRDEGNYIGPTINRTARLRDSAHGGQIVMTAVAEELVIDRLPAGTWLTDLGTHQLRDLPRPERVVQLCHQDLRVDFPPLRAAKTGASQTLPVQLTSFVGRDAEINALRQILASNRLVTLTGAGGVGKTRLAMQLASELVGEFGDGVWYVDLAPITDPDILSATMARAMGLPDQPGRSTMDTLIHFVGNRRMLVVLDNCEHLLDESAVTAAALLIACSAVTLLATSREPIRAAGEVTWQVPSLSLADEAIELFTDRARQVQPKFSITDNNATTVTEICRRLDCMPLAIELAAARVRALSLAEILDSLHDRFRLLTGGARTAVRRQQTLRASVDWSHALLTEPERVLFRRLAAFMGGFDLDAAQAVCGGGEVQRYQVLDQLTMLVDKSLVAAEDGRLATRYRMLETVRQYALEKLGESGEADAVRARHRDHYTAMAGRLDTPTRADHQRRVEQAAIEIDNLRAAFAWSHEHNEITLALELASSLQPLWLARGRLREGLAWFAQTAHQLEVAPALRARALADKAVLDAWAGATDSVDRAHQALTIARDVDDTALLARALTACGYTAGLDPELARPYFAEAMGLTREIGDSWRLCHILSRQAYLGSMAGDPIAARAAGEEGRDLADAIGDWFASRLCRWSLAMAQWLAGDLAGATAQFDALAEEAEADHDVIGRVISLVGQNAVLAFQGDSNAALAAAHAAIEAGAELDVVFEGAAYAALVYAALAAGDAAAAREASAVTWQYPSVQRATVAINAVALAALASGDLVAAQRLADDAVATLGGWHRMFALTTRCHIAIAQGENQKAEDDAHAALTLAAGSDIRAGVPDILECLGSLATHATAHPEGARLLGAADAIRQRTGEVRFPMHADGYHASIATLRNTMGEHDFEKTWSEGAALSTDEAIAYARRGRGERKRPTTGWASLTPAELNVARLISEGLPNKDIAERLFVSPRTVQIHLTHVYTKLGLTSRVQLAQEATRHS
jgi:predicted ATPase/class 3 adenylate cyclase/DNA-binding CsgD family transcriptional regulator